MIEPQLELSIRQAVGQPPPSLVRRSRNSHRISRTRRIPPHRSDESDGDSARNRTIRIEAHRPDAVRLSEAPLFLRESAGSNPAPDTQTLA